MAMKKLLETAPHKANEALTHVLGALKDDDWHVRYVAVQTMVSLVAADADQTAKAVPNVVEALKDTHSDVRHAAVNFLASVAAMSSNAAA